MSSSFLWRCVLRVYTKINRELERVPHAIKAAIVERFAAHFKAPLDAIFCRDAVLLAPRLELLGRDMLNVNYLPVSETE
jgi:hypothetical protein